MTADSCKRQGPTDRPHYAAALQRGSARQSMFVKPLNLFLDVILQQIQQVDGFFGAAIKRIK